MHMHVYISLSIYICIGTMDSYTNYMYDLYQHQSLSPFIYIYACSHHTYIHSFIHIYIHERGKRCTHAHAHFWAPVAPPPTDRKPSQKSMRNCSSPSSDGPSRPVPHAYAEAKVGTKEDEEGMDHVATTCCAKGGGGRRSGRRRKGKGEGREGTAEERPRPRRGREGEQPPRAARESPPKKRREEPRGGPERSPPGGGSGAVVTGACQSGGLLQTSCLSQLPSDFCLQCATDHFVSSL